MQLGEFVLADEGELEALAGRLEARLCPGDVLGLIGGLGVGKSVFARAVITAAQRRLGLVAEAVPSPSFSLMQFYPRPSKAAPNGGIWHVDLWRLDNATAEAEELGLMEAMANEVCLIEWADKLNALPAKTLYCHLSFVAAIQSEARRITFSTAADFVTPWQQRLETIGLSS